MKKKIIIIGVIIVIMGVICILLLNNRLNNQSNNTLLYRSTYHYPHFEKIKIEGNGKLYKSKIVDELTVDGAPKDQFNYVKKISNTDLKEIKSIINNMKKEEKKIDNFSNDYGISVNLGEDEFYSCEYFNQKEVDKLNIIIKKYEKNIK